MLVKQVNIIQIRQKGPKQELGLKATGQSKIPIMKPSSQVNQRSWLTYTNIIKS